MEFLAFVNFLPFILAGGLGFSFLVGFHELGHFIFCKIFGVKTPSFSIGFGPRLLEKKIGETVFTLSAIPFGGYVEIAGADEPGQGEQKDRASRASDSFAIKPYYQKMLIIAGGILFNLIFAYVAVIMAFTLGAPETPLLFPLSATAIIETIEEKSPAKQAALEPQDEIIRLKVSDSDISNREYNHTDFIQKVLETIQRHPGQQALIAVNRGNEVLTKEITLGNKNGRGFIGTKFISKEVAAENFYQACSMAIGQVNFWIYSTGHALSHIFKEKNVKSIGGPVMVITQMVKGAEKGFVIFMLFLAFISVNLAVMNLIPLPVFDGGQALFYTIEALIGRPLPESVRNGIAYGTWILLLLLILWITAQDILKLIQ